MKYCVEHGQRGGSQFCIRCLRAAWDRARELMEVLHRDGRDATPALERATNALDAALEPAEVERPE